MPSIKRFLGDNIKRFQRIGSGYSVSDKLRILGIAVLQSVPNTIRKSISGLDNKIEEITEKLCKTIIIEIDGIQYSLLDHESLEIVSREFESFMQAWFEPRKREVFVDIGAHIGKYALHAAKVVGNEGMVVAIEPHPVNYQTLQRNIELNKLENVIALNLAAWNMDCKLKLFTGDATARHSIKTNWRRGWLEVEARVMDHVLKELGIGPVNRIKIDVEGAEYEVLCGLEETISKYKPKIVIEVFCKNVDKVKRYLKKHGYDLVRIARMHISSFEWCVYFICIPLLS